MKSLEWGWRFVHADEGPNLMSGPELRKKRDDGLVPRFFSVGACEVLTDQLGRQGVASSECIPHPG